MIILRIIISSDQSLMTVIMMVVGSKILQPQHRKGYCNAAAQVRTIKVVQTVTVLLDCSVIGYALALEHTGWPRAIAYAAPCGHVPSHSYCTVMVWYHTDMINF